jgi:hypothetical protein
LAKPAFWAFYTDNIFSKDSTFTDAIVPPSGTAGYAHIAQSLGMTSWSMYWHLM